MAAHPTAIEPLGASPTVPGRQQTRLPSKPLIASPAMPSAPNDARRGLGTLARTVSIVGSLVGVLGVLFVARILVSEWPTITASLESATVSVLIASIPVAIVGMGWIGAQWNATIAALGGEAVRSGALLRSYYVGQMGKYVPGGVWPVLGRAELLVRYGTARRIAYTSVGLSMITTYLAAVLLAAAAAPFALSSSSGGEAWFLLTLPLGLIVLHPSVLGKVIAVGERLFSKGEPTAVPPWRTAALLVCRHVPAWVLISVATYVVARSLHIDIGLPIVLFATPLAWGAGLIAIPVPGGIGVRESVFIALVAGSAGSADAATLAVAARLVFVVGDALAALASTVLVPAPSRAAV
jgi:glycosyltransferase 2 family protein